MSRLAVSDGGFVQSSHVQVQQAGTSEANLDLSLPSAKLSAALASLGQLAPVRAESQSLQDITNTYDAARQRLADATAERQALLRALSKATTEGQIDSLHERIAQNRGAIAQARLSLQAVSQHASTAEVEVTVLGDAHAGSEGLTLHRGLHDAGRVLVRDARRPADRRRDTPPVGAAGRRARDRPTDVAQIPTRTRTRHALRRRKPLLPCHLGCVRGCCSFSIAGFVALTAAGSVYASTSTKTVSVHVQPKRSRHRRRPHQLPTHRSSTGRRLLLRRHRPEAIRALHPGLTAAVLDLQRHGKGRLRLPAVGPSRKARAHPRKVHHWSLVPRRLLRRRDLCRSPGAALRKQISMPQRTL